MLSADGVVLLIGLLVNAAAIVLSGWLNSRKVNLVISDVKKIEVATNNMKDELIVATKATAILEGKQEAKKEVEEEIKKDIKEIKQEIKWKR